MNAVGKDGKTALERAIRSKKSEAVVRQLVEKGASITYRVLEAVEVREPYKFYLHDKKL